jgi:hypothetical protein
VLRVLRRIVDAVIDFFDSGSASTLWDWIDRLRDENFWELLADWRFWVAVLTLAVLWKRLERLVSRLRSRARELPGLARRATSEFAEDRGRARRAIGASVLLGFVSIAGCRHATRFSELERAWEDARSSVVAADLDGFPGRWDALERAADAMRASMAVPSGDVELFMAKRRRELVGVVDESWPRIERRLTSRARTSAITARASLASEPRVLHRLSALDGRLRRHGVILRVDVRGDPDVDPWRAIITSQVTALATDLWWIDEWPLSSPQPDSLPTVTVTAELRGDEEPGDSGSPISTSVEIRLVREGRSLPRIPQRCDTFVGPIDPDVVTAEVPDHPDPAMAVVLAKPARARCRQELAARLRTELPPALRAAVDSDPPGSR